MTVVLLLALLPAGCNDMRWREACAGRQERIGSLLERYSAGEASRPERIEGTLGGARELWNGHPEMIPNTWARLVY